MARITSMEALERRIEKAQEKVSKTKKQYDDAIAVLSDLLDKRDELKRDELVKAIKAASPTTKIALQTMYPVSASYDTSVGIDNQKISNGNRWINEIAADNGVACINSAPSLVDSSGYRPEAWQNGDGLHMSAQGFAAVMNYIINNPCY